VLNIQREFVAMLGRPSAVLALLLCVGAGAAHAHEYSAKGVSVLHPWARATPGGATVGAAYLEIKTGAGTSDRLIGAKSPVAGRAEIHTHIAEGDVMRMRRVEALPLPPGKSHVLAPSGDHVMLFDLERPLKEGDSIKLTLVFEKAGEIEVDASVEPLGAKGPHGFEGQPGQEHDHRAAGPSHNH
jgi:copper(I)-binding protein